MTIKFSRHVHLFRSMIALCFCLSCYWLHWTILSQSEEVVHGWPLLIKTTTTCYQIDLVIATYAVLEPFVLKNIQVLNLVFKSQIRSLLIIGFKKEVRSILAPFASTPLENKCEGLYQERIYKKCRTTVSYGRAQNWFAKKCTPPAQKKSQTCWSHVWCGFCYWLKVPVGISKYNELVTVELGIKYHSK